jgi:hypothetical protein
MFARLTLGYNNPQMTSSNIHPVLGNPKGRGRGAKILVIVAVLVSLLWSVAVTQLDFGAGSSEPSGQSTTVTLTVTKPWVGPFVSGLWWGCPLMLVAVGILAIVRKATLPGILTIGYGIFAWPVLTAALLFFYAISPGGGWSVGGQELRGLDGRTYRFLSSGALGPDVGYALGREVSSDCDWTTITRKYEILGWSSNTFLGKWVPIIRPEVGLYIG